jgi:hypothetical protein
LAAPPGVVLRCAAFPLWVLLASSMLAARLWLVRHMRDTTNIFVVQ